MARLTARVLLGSSVSVFGVMESQAGCHADLAFTWVLRIQSLVLRLAASALETPEPSSSLQSSLETVG